RSGTSGRHHAWKAAGGESGRRLRPDDPQASARSYDLYRGGNGDGVPDLISGTDHCQPVKAAPADIPAWTADPRQCPVWNDRTGCRTADCGTRFYLLDSGQRVYYSGRRYLFPVSAADKTEGLRNEYTRTDKNIRWEDSSGFSLV